MNLNDFNPNGVGVDNGSYFGLPCDVESSRVVLISAPWDVTVSYGAGTAFAPDAIIEASTQLDLYDPSAPDAWREGIATAAVDYSIQEMSQALRKDAVRIIDHLEEGGALSDFVISRKLKRVNEGSVKLNQNIYNQAIKLLKEGKIVGLVGGDHSTPYGLIRAVGECYAEFGVLHIDAHCDLRVAYEGFEFSHASIMHNVLRDVEQISKIVEVGVRDFCDDELKVASESDRVEMFDDVTLSRERFEGVTWAQQCQRIVDALPQNVYVSFDIDGLAMNCCPHTGTPVPGGLAFNEAVYLLEMVVKSGRKIIGFDVVEVTPSQYERVDAIVGARILYKLCGVAIMSNPKRTQL
ncbi:MAG: agmatinase family protein [Rikenellaceae bacterium]